MKLMKAQIPDIPINRIRSDFEKIFNYHSYTCMLIRYKDSQTGDFFDISGDSGTTQTPIRISIQGTADMIQRLIQGIEMPKARIHCYTKYNSIEIRPTDLIKFNDKYFKIDNFHEAIKNGEIAFYEFDLEYASHRAP